MKTENEWRQDPEYVSLVKDLLEQPAVKRLAHYKQHHHSNRRHSGSAHRPGGRIYRAGYHAGGLY